MVRCGTANTAKRPRMKPLAEFNPINNQSGQAQHPPLSLRLLSLVPATTALCAFVTSTLLSSARKDSGHCRKIGTVHRLSSSGRAVSVSQSLSGLRSSQSQTHGCCQRSGYAAGVTSCFRLHPALYATSPVPGWDWWLLMYF